MGMTRAEIDSRLESIVAFSEIGSFMDTPVKRYSSGMYVRLAFAVAAHLEPEIFIIDEVLAVGDVGFQEKCLGKIGEIVHEGRTVLFVSHNMGAVRKLCSRVLWLKAGRVEQFGETGAVVDAYLTGQASREGEFRPASDRDSWHADYIILKRVSLRNQEGDLVASFSSDSRGFPEIEYQVVMSTARTRVGFGSPRRTARSSSPRWTTTRTDAGARASRAAT
jgi:lipopolysaccharide transport system ATP-binding protein